MSVTYVESSIQVPASGRTTATIPVPNPGAAINDIAVVGVYKENAAAVTPPDISWTLKAQDVVNAGTQGALHVFWKRLSAVDTGSYAFSWSGASYAGGHGILMRGCVETGDPFHDFTILRTADNAGAVISAAVNGQADGAALSFVSSWATATRTWTAPSGFIRQEQSINQATGTKVGLTAGSTGAVTWTGNGNDFYQIFLGTLKPIPSVPTGPTLSVISGGTKKTAIPYVIIGGVKKAATPYVIAGGVKK